MKKYLNIAIFTDSYRPSVNGVTTSIDNLSLRLAQRGHKISIVSPTIDSSVHTLHENIELISVPSIPASFYDDFRWSSLRTSRIYEKLKASGVNIVHIMTPVITSYLGIKIGRSLNVPIVGTYHTLIADPTYYEQLFRTIIKPNPKMAWEYTNLYYNATDLVTAPTQKMIDLLKENHCTTKLIPLSNGIDPTVFDNSGMEEIKKKYKIGEKAILYLGRVSKEKNIFLLIDSFEKVYAKHPDAQLIIVGDGPKREEIEAYARRMDSSSNIVFTGMIPYDELVKSGIYAACRLFATASVTETQGITLLEALHNGLPCVGADALGVSETIDHGKTGFLFPPKDTKAMTESILKLIEDDELHNRMSLEAIEQAKPHHIKSIISRWESIYLDLIEEHSQGKIPPKDYLHMRSILSSVKNLRIENPLFNAK